MSLWLVLLGCFNFFLQQFQQNTLVQQHPFPGSLRSTEYKPKVKVRNQELHTCVNLYTFVRTIWTHIMADGSSVLVNIHCNECLTETSCQQHVLTSSTHEIVTGWFTAKNFRSNFILTCNRQCKAYSYFTPTSNHTL